MAFSYSVEMTVDMHLSACLGSSGHVARNLPWESHFEWFLNKPFMYRCPECSTDARLL